ncbi:MAG: hypothetical protein ACXWT1_10750 [Methylobacter sp.]
MALILRLSAIAVSLYLMGDLLSQFAAGSISMGYGEFNDQIVVTSLFGRTLAVLMWAPFFGGLLIAGVSPGLFFDYRRLLPSLLIAVFVFYMLFSITSPYSLK